MDLITKADYPNSGTITAYVRIIYCFYPITSYIIYLSLVSDDDRDGFRSVGQSAQVIDKDQRCRQ